MERRTFLALLALPAVAQVLAACGDDDPPSTKGRRSSLKSSSARVTNGTDPAAAAGAVNAFAADLYEQLVTADPDANLVFSPASIAIALTMASAGARGRTLDEMDGVLYITDTNAIHQSMNGLAAVLAAANKSKDMTPEGGSGVQTVQVNIANSLWGQLGLTFEPAFLDLLAAQYGAGMETVDYVTDPDGARVAINAWVSDATEQRIPELLTDGAITTETLLTLVNAVYLKAAWAQEFFESATTSSTFTTSKGAAKKVPMMHRGGDIAYATGDGWQAIELDYVFGDLGMVLAVGDTPDSVLPDGPAVFGQLSSTLVDVSLPKFDHQTTTALAKVLQAMGMTTPFGDSADFSGMTKEAALFISGVVHQANITVDEKGTEAAAATAITMAGTAAPEQPPIEVRFDRPFTYWLREKSTNAILFMGRVNDPTG